MIIRRVQHQAGESFWVAGRCTWLESDLTPHGLDCSTGTRQRCEAELAKLDKQIGRKERELEGVNRQLAEATARQGGFAGCMRASRAGVIQLA